MDADERRQILADAEISVARSLRMAAECRAEYKQCRILARRIERTLTAMIDAISRIPVTMYERRW